MSSQSTNNQRVAVILAAGAGTRMKSDLPKVAHLLLEKPLVRWVVDAAQEAGCTQIVTVVGHGCEVVEPLVPDTSIAFQAQRLGTGDAVKSAAEYLEGKEGSVVVLCGDAPLIRPQTIAQLIATQEQSGAAAVVLTMVVDNPAGYGRIIRDEQGGVACIVEHKDCTEEQLAVKECNSGFYCFDIPQLLDSLGKLSNNNAQGEYYLTDCIGICVEAGLKVEALIAEDYTEALGINSPEQLEEASSIMSARQANL